MKTLSRRRWMSGLALAAAAGRTGRAVPSGPAVVDAHAHVWSPDLHKYPLAPGLTREDLWFPSFTVEELVERGSRAGVTRYNLIQIARAKVTVPFPAPCPLSTYIPVSTATTTAGICPKTQPVCKIGLISHVSPAFLISPGNNLQELETSVVLGATVGN